jgi:hypothetical protein
MKYLTLIALLGVASVSGTHSRSQTATARKLLAQIKQDSAPTQIYHQDTWAEPSTIYSGPATVWNGATYSISKTEEEEESSACPAHVEKKTPETLSLYYRDTKTGFYNPIAEPTPTITQYYTYDESTSTYSSYEGPISYNMNAHKK